MYFGVYFGAQRGFSILYGAEEIARLGSVAQVLRPSEEIGSKSGPNRRGSVGFGGGRCQRGRSGWEGPVAPRKFSPLLQNTADEGQRDFFNQVFP